MADVAAESCRAARESLASATGAVSAAASADAARAALTELAAAQATAHVAFASTGASEPAAEPPTLRPVSISPLHPRNGRRGRRAGRGGGRCRHARPNRRRRSTTGRPIRRPSCACCRGTAGRWPGWSRSSAAPTSGQGRRWQACLSEFVDAMAGAAVDQGYFVFPNGHPFWGQFTVEQSRELARGLASLGFRYDGRDGFADDHAPGPRDLTMAAGNAGLPTVRVRYWPAVEDAALLYRGVGVDAAAVLAEHAPAATMGQLMQLIGRRAETMSDIWNDWPRVRPLLLGSGSRLSPRLGARGRQRAGPLLGRESLLDVGALLLGRIRVEHDQPVGLGRGDAGHGAALGQPAADSREDALRDRAAGWRGAQGLDLAVGGCA